MCICVCICAYLCILLHISIPSMLKRPLILHIYTFYPSFICLKDVNDAAQDPEKGLLWLNRLGIVPEGYSIASLNEEQRFAVARLVTKLQKVWKACVVCSFRLRWNDQRRSRYEYSYKGEKSGQGFLSIVHRSLCFWWLYLLQFFSML